MQQKLEKRSFGMSFTLRNRLYLNKIHTNYQQLTILKLKKINQFLKQPYPFYYQNRNFYLFVLFLFLLAFAFNYFFKPFDVHVPEHKMDYLWISVIHSFTPVVIALLFFPLLKKPDIENTWTIGKEILLIAIYLFLIGSVQFLIRDIIYDNPNNWSWRYFFEEIRNTFLVGILLISILISLNYNRLNSQNIKKAARLHFEKDLGRVSISTDSVAIRTQVKSDDFELNPSNFVYAKSDGNYTEIYILKEDKAEKLLKRISIKELELQLNSITTIVRTHRSYVVNIDYLDKVTGNAQGYRLHLKNTDNLVPVSRNMITQFEEHTKALGTSA